MDVAIATEQKSRVIESVGSRKERRVNVVDVQTVLPEMCK